ncbi:TlpA family protein disulfide reductase [Streptomyces actinomycinicus]|uniref:TlpA family protein disulfide reductase n=1 Tax=Streptomyces actinomycinicus TaxID=1695166 RepID=A0A937EHP9_9ACTN|nr:TlpA disulfide reductase family protein [Streptomyces actinomycinicus]MBL1082294.1 TlpA family protein disulfide reductase [Streptomyces actinomycinicus]
MAYLTAVVTLFGLMSIVNLILTFGVVRRLRTQEDGSTPAAEGDPFQGSGLTVGEPVGSFSVHDTEGRPVTRDSLREGMLVAFLSPGCLPCEELLPGVVELARTAGPGQVLAAVVVDGDDGARPDAFVAALSPVATVAVTRLGGELTRAFEIKGLPTAVRIGPEGRVAARGRALLRVAHSVRAGA